MGAIKDPRPHPRNPPRPPRPRLALGMKPHRPQSLPCLPVSLKIFVDEGEGLRLWRCAGSNCWSLSKGGVDLGSGTIPRFNGASIRTGGGALRLVDVINCGLDTFKQVLNSIVEPRYCEQLYLHRKRQANMNERKMTHQSPQITPDMNGTSHTKPIVRIDSNDDTFD